MGKVHRSLKNERQKSGGNAQTRERRKSARERWTNNRETAAKFFN